MKASSAAMNLAKDINEKFRETFTAETRQDSVWFNCVVVTNNQTKEQKACYSKTEWYSFAKRYGIDARPKLNVYVPDNSDIDTNW